MIAIFSHIGDLTTRRVVDSIERQGGAEVVRMDTELALSDLR